MPSVDRKLRVFLCHASQDKPIVRELYQRPITEGWIEYTQTIHEFESRINEWARENSIIRFPFVDGSPNPIVRELTSDRRKSKNMVKITKL